MQRRNQQSKGGFTLIEVLVATFILVIIVMILSKIFHQSSVCWSAGTRRAQGNLTGRSAVGLMARELMNAASDSVYFDPLSIGSGNSITFVTLAGNDPSNRVAHRISYSLGAQSLERSFENASSGNYGSWGSTKTWIVATNVKDLVFDVPPTPPGYDVSIPPWVRIILTLYRSDDVSGVGASSKGPDRAPGTEDDIRSR